MKKFKEWVHRTRLVVVADPRTKRTDINPAKIVEIGIVEIWENEWILPRLKVRSEIAT